MNGYTSDDTGGTIDITVSNGLMSGIPENQLQIQFDESGNGSYPKSQEEVPRFEAEALDTLFKIGVTTGSLTELTQFLKNTGNVFADYIQAKIDEKDYEGQLDVVKIQVAGMYRMNRSQHIFEVLNTMAHKIYQQIGNPDGLEIKLKIHKHPKDRWLFVADAFIKYKSED